MDFKPRPYTKREFLSKLQNPYENPETKVEVAPVQKISTEVKPGQPEINRAEQVSMKDDTKNKTFSIGLEDIDAALLYYLKDVIKPTVMQNSKQIEVPVIYGSPERWKSMQADGFYRDKNGKTMNQGSRFVARMPNSNNYLAYDGKGYSFFISKQEMFDLLSQGYEKIPNDWWKKARFI